MNRPVGIDLCCGAGGATRGYQLSGFAMVGVDIHPQPNYCGERFIQADIADVDLHGLVDLYGAVFVHGSPPCQLFTTLNQGNRNRTKQVGRRDHVDLLTPTRLRLDELGIPYVLENVPSAPIRRDVQLCGEMFGLEVIRHRNFELSGFTAPQPAHIKHRGRVSGMRHGEWFTGPYFAVYGDGGGKGTVAQWQRAMGGMDWTDVRLEIAESIPAAYTAYIARFLMSALSEQVAA